MGRHPIRVLCIALLLGAWGLDVISPQLLVVAILLTIPIALSSLVLDQRFTYTLIVLALVANASAGWYNSFHDQNRWDIIAVTDRLLASLSIALVGILSIKTQQTALHAGELAERQVRSDILRDLVYALSHDLRTPLTAAKMTMQQALEGQYGELPEAYREILRRSVTSNEELNRLAETLLLVARYESGDQSRMRETVDVARITQSVIEELRPLASSKDIHLDVSGATESCYVLADEAEMRRALTNLIANAVTWTPRGGRISVAAHSVDSMLQIEVEDNGYGVPEAVRSRLFDRFVGGSRQGGGSGLGLYIVRRIAEGHQGTISYRPSATQGSVFILKLPLYQVERPDA
ncbi:MAG: HAMP domain-containing histidine kinase [Candidatus Eremiobacteraeota bacterium]|nr:HAMP domain-containing histidine kinase [Candidatus Eremiobacteraeota bacterium]